MFFLEAVAKTAECAVQLAHDILAQFDEDQGKVETLGTRSSAAAKVFQELKRVPYLSAAEASAIAGISFPAADRGLKELQTLGVVE